MTESWQGRQGYRVLSTIFAESTHLVSDNCQQNPILLGHCCHGVASKRDVESSELLAE